MFQFVKSFILISIVLKFEPLDKLLLFLGRHLKTFRNFEEKHRRVIVDKVYKRATMQKNNRRDL